MHRCPLILLAIFVVGCEGDGGRIELPFTNVETNVDLTLPGGTIATGCGDGSYVGESCFNPPVHPIGEVFSIRIEGHDVAISDTKLVNGLLRTRDFGALEFQVSRFDPMTGKTFDILVTRKQIRQIESQFGIASPASPESSSSAVAPGNAGPVAQLRYAGLYQASVGDRDNYLRFWDDGSVVEVSVEKPSTAQDLGSRMYRGTPGAGGS